MMQPSKHPKQKTNPAFSLEGGAAVGGVSLNLFNQGTNHDHNAK